MALNLPRTVGEHIAMAWLGDKKASTAFRHWAKIGADVVVNRNSRVPNSDCIQLQYAFSASIRSLGSIVSDDFPSSGSESKPKTSGRLPVKPMLLARGRRGFRLLPFRFQLVCSRHIEPDE